MLLSGMRTTPYNLYYYQLLHYAATKSKETRYKILALASAKDFQEKLINKSLIPTFAMYILYVYNKPKVGIELLFENLLCLLVPGSYTLFPYFLLLYSESLLSLLPFRF